MLEFGVALLKRKFAFLTTCSFNLPSRLGSNLRTLASDLFPAPVPPKDFHALLSPGKSDEKCSSGNIPGLICDIWAQYVTPGIRWRGLFFDGCQNHSFCGSGHGKLQVWKTFRGTSVTTLTTLQKTNPKHRACNCCVRSKEAKIGSKLGICFRSFLKSSVSPLLPTLSIEILVCLRRIQIRPLVLIPSDCWREHGQISVRFWARKQCCSDTRMIQFHPQNLGTAFLRAAKWKLLSFPFCPLQTFRFISSQKISIIFYNINPAQNR